MSTASPHAEISDYCDEVLSTPRAHLSLELRQDGRGLSLLHEERTLVECRLTLQGMLAAGYMAEALGASVPPLGTSAAVRVSTGVLARAVSIASLDYTVEESALVLERLLEEAEMQRGGSTEDV